MESRRKRNLLLLFKWLSYFALLWLAIVIQTTPRFLSIGSAKPALVLPVCLAVALCEDEFQGALFGALGGVWWDFTAGRVAGLLALGLMVLCFACSVLTQQYLRINHMNFILLVALTALFLLSSDFLFYYFMPGYGGAAAQYLGVVLPTCIFTAVFAPLILPLVQAVYRRFTPAK